MFTKIDSTAGKQYSRLPRSLNWFATSPRP